MRRKLVRKISLTAERAAKLIADALVDELPEKLRDKGVEGGGITVEVEFQPEVFESGEVKMDVIAEVFIGKDE